ncbi:MAG: ABC transporter permease [Methylacidiphilales bacterium]|nr:ABC transporter permease [Candidatus Methylacidiphilales bacterium]MDW8349693.1 ABC transporter permease subunit [Verrucomicrobiae bacterium]
MLRVVVVLAQLSFRDLMRQRTLHLIFLFAFVILALTPLFIELSFAEQLKFVKDFCFGAMVIFNVAMALLGASHLLWGDMESRSLLTILAKPVDRWQVIVGKFLGLGLMLALTIGFMTVMAFLISQWKKGMVIEEEKKLWGEGAAAIVEKIEQENRPELFFQAAVLVWCKAVIMAAITLFLTTVATSPIFSVLCGVLIYLIGHLQGVAREALLTGEVSRAVEWLLWGLQRVMPDFSIFAPLEAISTQGSLSWGYVGQVVVYAVVLCCGALLLGIVAFQRRDF